MYESNDKMVSHPPHYMSKNGLEVIDVIEAFTFDLRGIEATDTGNIIKYICRWKHKNGLQDLKKAMWYIQHLIEHVEKQEKEDENIQARLRKKIKEATDEVFDAFDKYPELYAWQGSFDDFMKKISEKEKK